MTNQTQKTFLIRVDSQPVKHGQSWRADCKAQLSGKVHVFSRDVVKVGHDRWGYFIKASASTKWLTKSRQPWVVKEFNRQHPSTQLIVPVEQDRNRVVVDDFDDQSYEQFELNWNSPGVD